MILDTELQALDAGFWTLHQLSGVWSFLYGKNAIATVGVTKSIP